MRSIKYMNNRQLLGKYGEDIACKYLCDNGYKIIERNFLCMQGEIDIIAYDISLKELVFFEVKTRKNFRYGNPSEAVTKIKKRHIIKTIEYYLFSKCINEVFIRIDVIEIVFNKNTYKLNHLKKVLQ